MTVWLRRECRQNDLGAMDTVKKHCLAARFEIGANCSVILFQEKIQDIAWPLASSTDFMFLLVRSCISDAGVDGQKGRAQAPQA